MLSTAQRTLHGSAKRFIWFDRFRASSCAAPNVGMIVGSERRNADHIMISMGLGGHSLRQIILKLLLFFEFAEDNHRNGTHKQPSRGPRECLPALVSDPGRPHPRRSSVGLSNAGDSVHGHRRSVNQYRSLGGWGCVGSAHRLGGDAPAGE